MKENFPLSRQHGIVVQNLNGEILIYDLQANQAFCLNETSALVWQMCDGTKNIADISRLVSEKLKQSVSNDLVWLSLDALKKNNLLDENQQIEIDFQGFSRREIIRRVGLASMIALPLISSLVAPSANFAASNCRTVTMSCTSPSQCCSNVPTCTTVAPRQCCLNDTGTAPPGSNYFSDPNFGTTCASDATTICCSGTGRATGNTVPGLGNECECT